MFILMHLQTVKAFLPDMMERKQGHVVTVGSVAGIMGTYLCTDYSASKAATIAFHEALLTELMVRRMFMLKPRYDSLPFHMVPTGGIRPVVGIISLHGLQNF